ncbi:MAG: hypothetical protein ACNYWM_05790 [Methanosarcinales archaeon]
MNLFCNNRTFTFSNLAALVNYSATFAVSFLLSLYLQYIKGLPPQSADMVLVGQMLSMGIAMLLFALFIGRAQITPEYYSSFVETHFPQVSKNF